MFVARAGEATMNVGQSRKYARLQMVVQAGVRRGPITRVSRECVESSGYIQPTIMAL